MKTEMTYRWINEIPLLIHSILPDPESYALHDRHRPAHLPRSTPALKLLHTLQLALDRKDSFLDPRTLDLLTVVARRQPANGPFTRSIWCVDGRRVRRFQKVLANDVDCALARLIQVVQTVLDFFTILKTAREANDEQRRVMIDQLEVAKRRQVGRLAVLASSGHKCNGTWHDRTDQQLVVVHRAAAFGIGVNRDVLGVAGGEIVCAITSFPTRLRSLLISKTCIAVERRSGRLDAFEVRVRIALDIRLLHPEGGVGRQGCSSCGGVRAEQEDAAAGGGGNSAERGENACCTCS